MNIELTKTEYVIAVATGISFGIALAVLLIRNALGFYCMVILACQDMQEMYDKASSYVPPELRPRDPKTKLFVSYKKPRGTWQQCRWCIISRIGLIGLGVLAGGVLLEYWPTLPGDGWTAMQALFYCGACQ